MAPISVQVVARIERWYRRRVMVGGRKDEILGTRSVRAEYGKEDERNDLQGGYNSNGHKDKSTLFASGLVTQLQR